LARFGQAIDLSAHPDWSAREWTDHLERALEATQDALAQEAYSRNPDRFVTLIEGKVGVGGVYDVWRRFRAWLGGRRFDAGHGGAGHGGGR
jgi:hypothetical protein